MKITQWYGRVLRLSCLVARAKLGYCAPGGLVDVVETLLQSMMDASLPQSHRCGLVRAPGHRSPLPSLFLDQTALFCENPSIVTTTTYTATLLLSHGCCATSHQSVKATLPRFAYPQAEIYIATPVDFAGQGISQAHSPSFDCTAALTQHGSTPHHTTALTSSPPATPS
jgi:hypothetical protein